MASGGSGQGDVFDVRKLRRFVELMNEHDLSEVDLRQGDQRIRLRRGQEPVVVAGGQPAAAATPPPVAATPAAGSPSEEETNAAYVVSPMVGTFYTASSPDSSAYVKVGDQVGPETVVCIIEAMKVFNEIPAECSGSIVAMLVENGDVVEYGQKLYKVEPAS